jgi:hypothetical protein
VKSALLSRKPGAIVDPLLDHDAWDDKFIVPFVEMVVVILRKPPATGLDEFQPINLGLVRHGHDPP